MLQIPKGIDAMAFDHPEEIPEDQESYEAWERRGLEQKEGFWYRPGTSDVVSIGDTRRLFKREAAPELLDVVLDLGAHIGTFTKRALDVGVSQVKAVEPAPDNTRLFRLNIDDPRVELIEAAACDSLIGEETFYLNQKKGTDSHSLTERRGRVPIQVKTVSLAELCSDFSPTYVKIDIEGGEYLLDIVESFPDSADRLFMEYHFQKAGRRERALEIRAQLMGDLGFELVWGSNWTEKAWWVEEMYRR